MIILWIQPTWRIHIGNYFGVLQPWLDMNASILVAQYHANSSEIETDKFMISLSKIWFNIIQKQSPEVLELFYELAHSESVAELSRLPQYQTKEKTLHMLSYPLLMACDIILSKATQVLVGEDQAPHMHYYREVARRNGYRVAREIILPDRQIKSIKDPTKKMSKSLGDDHCIYLDDSYEEVERKISKAPTTPEWVKELKKIAEFIWFTYDETRNGYSKWALAFEISDFLNRIMKVW